MAEKRDYYEVLGVPKTATEAEIKKHSGPLQKNIIRTFIRAIRSVRRNLKRRRRPMRS